MALTQPCEAMKVAQFCLQLWEIKALPNHFLLDKESWWFDSYSGLWKCVSIPPFASEITILFQNPVGPHSKVRWSPFASTMRGVGGGSPFFSLSLSHLNTPGLTRPLLWRKILASFIESAGTHILAQVWICWCQVHKVSDCPSWCLLE